MPHLLLHGQQLHDAYPPLSVPEEEVLLDLARDDDDQTLQRRMEEAKAISMETRDHGRKRKMSPTTITTTTTTTSPTTTTTTKMNGTKTAKEETEGEANLVNNFEETEKATTRSALGRRRSEKEGPDSSHDSQDGLGNWHGKYLNKHSRVKESLRPCLTLARASCTARLERKYSILIIWSYIDSFETSFLQGK